jgi:hypothetical protein
VTARFASDEANTIRTGVKPMIDRQETQERFATLARMKP